MRLTNRFRERRVRIVKNFRGRAVGFRIDEIRLPNGQRARREFLTHPGAVGVLAFETRNSIILVKQYRYPVGQFTFEIPAGKLSRGENPLVCVKRELEEETGVQAGRIWKLLTFWPTGAFSDERLHLYVADRLIRTQAHPDEDEFLEIVRVSPRQLERMIQLGRIRDSKTIIAYLAWKSFRRRRRR